MKVLQDWKRAPTHQKIKIVVLAVIALMLFLLLQHTGSSLADRSANSAFYWQTTPPPPLKIQYLRYHSTGRIGDRAMAFVTALAIARANGRLLLVNDPVLTAIFDLSALNRDLTDEIPPGMKVDATTHFRENTDNRFADHVLRSSADVVHLGIAYDYSDVPIPPSVWNHMLLKTVHRHAASVLTAGIGPLGSPTDSPRSGPYDCLHYRGLDLVDHTTNLDDTAAMMRNHLSINGTLFVTTNGPLGSPTDSPRSGFEQSVRRRLTELLFPHTRIMFAPDSDLRLIENELWAIGTIGISLAVCAHASTLFLNHDSTFSDLMGALASSSARILYLG